MNEVYFVGNLVLSSILERRVDFLLNNEIVPYEGDSADRGEEKALKNMLEDSRMLNEKEFVNKYQGELASLKERFENKEYSKEDGDDYFESYNNTIVSILMIINPIYEYDLTE